RTVSRIRFTTPGDTNERPPSLRRPAPGQPDLDPAPERPVARPPQDTAAARAGRGGLRALAAPRLRDRAAGRLPGAGRADRGVPVGVPGLGPRRPPDLEPRRAPRPRDEGAERLRHGGVLPAPGAVGQPPGAARP